MDARDNAEAAARRQGHVFIVGAGPGDPGLVTVAGARAIAAADVIFYDALSSPALLRGARPGAELVYVGKRVGEHALSQEQLQGLIVARAASGCVVVRLKGGDPFVFGRGGEEALACRAAGIEYTVIPGVTSAVAAPAYAGIPLTHRGVAGNFLVVTGNEAAGEAADNSIDWTAASRADTLVILMGVGSLAAHMVRLATAGRAAETPVACIRWGTRPDQQVVVGTVATIAALAAEAGLRSPVVTVVGEAVRLGGDLAWYRPGALAGRRVVVTRARKQASALGARLEALGAYVVEAPAIEIVSRVSDANFQHTVSRQWDWMVFASANGVEAALDALWRLKRDSRWLTGTRVAAVGGATAEALVRRGLRPDFVPSKATAEALAAELPMVPGQRILHPASARSDGRLAATLRGRGATVEQVIAYENRTVPLDDERRREVAEADAITFTSASTARNLRAALGETAIPAAAKLVSIGPQTSVAVLEVFGRVDREAAQPDLDSLVDALTEVLAWG